MRLQRHNLRGGFDSLGLEDDRMMEVELIGSGPDPQNRIFGSVLKLSHLDQGTTATGWRGAEGPPTVRSQYTRPPAGARWMGAEGPHPPGNINNERKSKPSSLWMEQKWHHLHDSLEVPLDCPENGKECVGHDILTPQEVGDWLACGKIHSSQALRIYCCYNDDVTWA